ncbi:MAG: pyridoxamine 5'-phosphate oxidase family protein [Bacteroidia bacterium]|nr:pyridoxamine 5'-phosphate oxidase family protein [Bacteroidia bacterium]
MARTFQKTITSPEQLRQILGTPSELAVGKSIDHIDHNCQSFIEHSPFILIGSSDGSSFDVSPKGDPAGFVKVLDQNTLLIPDRKGNKRADTLYNVLQNPGVGLLFLIPGLKQSLRVNGIAEIIVDDDIRQMLAHKNSVPQVVLAVHVKEAFMHCTKCIIRSKLWDGVDQEAIKEVPSLAQSLIDHANVDKTLEQMEKRLEEGEKNRLY